MASNTLCSTRGTYLPRLWSSSGSRRQHTEVVSGRVEVRPPRQVTPPVVDPAAAPLGDAGLDPVGVVAGLEPNVEVDPVLRVRLDGLLGAQLEQRPPSRRV